MVFNINPELSKTLNYLSTKKYIYSDQCKVVLKQFSSFEKLFNRAIPLLNQHFNFIGMAHGTPHENSDNNIKIATDSQILVTKYLEELAADFVGVEGYSRNDFSVMDISREACLIQGIESITVPELILYATKNRSDPTLNGIFNYHKLNNECKFRGVESHELQRLCYLIDTYFIEGQLPETELHAFNHQLDYLRGLVMISKFVEYATKARAKQPTLPIGQLHIENEVLDIKTTYNCNWKIITTLPKNYKEIMDGLRI